MSYTRKITKEQADEIRQLYKEIEERKAKIKSFGLSQASLTCIKQGRTYQS